MEKLRRHVPSLNALEAFEAAGRLGGFTRAAEELRISQPAVTRHIRGLEAALNVVLFDRAHNRITLTDAGLRLWHAVNTGFAEVTRVAQDIAGTQYGDALNIAIPAGFGQQWLVPRLEALRTALGGRAINLSIIDRDDEFDRARFDVAVRQGSGNWPGQSADHLWQEQVMPVVSPGYFESHPDLEEGRAETLLNHKLIHMDLGEKPWMTWGHWFRLNGIAPPPEKPQVNLNHFPLVLQETLAGHGVGLGWRLLVDNLVETGALIPCGPEVVNPRCSWWLVQREDDPVPAPEPMLDWFKQEVQKSKDSFTLPPLRD